MLYEKEAKEFFLKNRGYVCAFAYGHPREFIAGTNIACHAGFMCPAGTAEYYSSLYQHDTVDTALAEEYWKYILGPSSPWKKGLKDVEFIKDDAGHLIAFKNSTDIDGFIAFSVTIGCRTPKESCRRLAAWAELRKHFTDVEALYLSALLHYDGRHWTWSIGGEHGYPFYGDRLSFKKLEDASPKTDGALFTTGSYDFIYCNHIWDGGVWLTHEPPVAIKAEPKYRGTFAGFKKTYESNKYEIKQGQDLINALKEWKDKWGNR